MPAGGPDPITVPGAAGGWGAIHELGARRPWAAAFEPAISLAESGVPVARSVANAIAECEPELRADPGMRAVFAAGGRLLGEGETLRQPALAASLRELAAGGPERSTTGRWASAWRADSSVPAAASPRMTCGPSRRRRTARSRPASAG